MSDVLDPRPFLKAPEGGAARLGAVASSVVNSQILKVAAEIRALQETGAEVCNLTIGDYNPLYFPVPKGLLSLITDALERGETNYAPTAGLPVIREAVAHLYKTFLKLDYPSDGVLVTSGARAAVYAVFMALVDKGEKVVNPVPSWNTHHYCALSQAENVVVESRPENGFLPVREDLEEAVKGARLLVLCSPGNPTGTLFSAEQLSALCDLVLEENARRGPGERPLYLMYDHVYWPIVHRGLAHVDPVTLRPEIARYTIFIDGISKGLAATGLRVGWAVGPPDLIAGMNRITGHGGSWAPKPLQTATARFLADEDAVRAAFAELQSRIEERLTRLCEGLRGLTEAGLPVRTIQDPGGALYLTLNVPIAGRSTPGGEALTSNDDIRRYLLTSAGLGVVPFEAFGHHNGLGWFRMSVGAASDEEIDALIPRLRQALEAL